MRIPSRILEHPIEAAIASLLLLGLLFGSADISPDPKAPDSSPNTIVQKF
jgi:hypothetical protein